MSAFAQTVTYLFAVLTLLLDAVVLLALVSRVATGMWVPASMRDVVERWALPVATLFAVFAVLCSLWYSEVVGIPVCVLCWFARSMIFPLAVILLVALFRKSTDVRPYALALSIVGMVVTGYHHLLQLGVVEGSFCSALSGGTDCARRYIFEFDWVTMPWFGFTLFSAIALLLWLGRR